MTARVRHPAWEALSHEEREKLTKARAASLLEELGAAGAVELLRDLTHAVTDTLGAAAPQLDARLNNAGSLVTKAWIALRDTLDLIPRTAERPSLRLVQGGGETAPPFPSGFTARLVEYDDGTSLAREVLEIHGGPKGHRPMQTFTFRVEGTFAVCGREGGPAVVQHCTVDDELDAHMGGVDFVGGRFVADDAYPLNFTDCDEDQRRTLTRSFVDALNAALDRDPRTLAGPSAKGGDA